jgi:hypothetical protein
MYRQDISDFSFSGLSLAFIEILYMSANLQTEIMILMSSFFILSCMIQRDTGYCSLKTGLKTTPIPAPERFSSHFLENELFFSVPQKTQSFTRIKELAT